MHVRSLALTVVLLATCASASSVINISTRKHYHTGPHPKRAAGADYTRAASLQLDGHNIRLINVLITYLAAVGVGYPPTNYSLMVDTGSSLTLCGTGTSPYIRTSTSIDTGSSVNATYGSGNFTGREYLDQVTLAPDLVIKNQTIGAALSSYGFDGLDGILGLGIANRSLLVMDNLVEQGLVMENIFSLYFSPPTNDNDTNGVLTLGGFDESLYEGELTYVPLTETPPSSNYWGINITSATFGNHTIIYESVAGVVDSGTSLVLLPNDFFSAYMNAIPGATMDSNSGLMEIPNSSIPYMHPLGFVIAGRTFYLDVNAQLMQQVENTFMGGAPGKWYSVISTLPNWNSGIGFDFILGQKFLERYYVAFDWDSRRVGFAQTNNTFTPCWDGMSP